MLSFFEFEFGCEPADSSCCTTEADRWAHAGQDVRGHCTARTFSSRLFNCSGPADCRCQLYEERGDHTKLCAYIVLFLIKKLSK